MKHLPLPLHHAWLYGIVTGGLLLLLLLIADSSKASGMDQEGGLAYEPLPEEFSQLNTADAVERRIAADIPSFGGFFLDPKTQRLQVWLYDVGDSGRLKQALDQHASGLSLSSGSPIEIRQGKFGFLQLQGWVDRLGQAVSSDPGLVYIDNQEGDNRIEIGVVDDAAQKRISKASDKEGIPADAVEFKTTAPMTTTGDLQNAYRPVTGGQKVTGHETCTLGFVAFLSGVAGVVTAAHCTDHYGQVNGTVFHQPYDALGVYRIGAETVDPPCGGLEANARSHRSPKAVVLAMRRSSSLIPAYWAVHRIMATSQGQRIIPTLGIIATDTRSPRWDPLYRDRTSSNWAR